MLCPYLPHPVVCTLHPVMLWLMSGIQTLGDAVADGIFGTMALGLGSGRGGRGGAEDRGRNGESRYQLGIEDADDETTSAIARGSEWLAETGEKGHITRTEAADRERLPHGEMWNLRMASTERGLGEDGWVEREASRCGWFGVGVLGSPGAKA